MPDPVLYLGSLRPTSSQAEYYNEEYREYIKVALHADAYFRELLLNENTPLPELAMAATVVQLAQSEIKDSRRLFVPVVTTEGPRYDVNETALGLPPVAEWRFNLQEKARHHVQLEKENKKLGILYDNKLKEYVVLADKIRLDPQVIRAALPPEQRGPDVWFSKSDETLRKALDFYSDELVNWSTSRHVDEEFLTTPAQRGLWEFNADRPLPMSLLRLAAVLPWDEPPQNMVDIQAMKAAMAREEAESLIYDQQLLYGDEEEERDLDNLQDLTDIVYEIGPENLPHSGSAIAETMEEIGIIQEEFESLPAREKSSIDPQLEFITWFIPETWAEILISFVPGLSRLTDIKSIIYNDNPWEKKLTRTERALLALNILAEAAFQALVMVALGVVANAVKPIKFILKPLITGFAFWEAFGETDAQAVKVPKQLQKRVAKMLMGIAAGTERITIKKISRPLAKRSIIAAERQYINNTFLRMGGKMAAVGSEKGLKDIPKILQKGWPKMLEKHPILRQLSSYALGRAAYKMHPDHIKGQLLEEIVRKLIREILKSRYAHELFQVQHFIKNGFVLEFVPGHLIQDVAGRQFTDGLLVLRYVGRKVGGKLVKETEEELAKLALTPTIKVVAVIECKAGAASSRGILSSGARSFAALEPQWKETVKMMALQRREEELAIAKMKIASGVKTGKAFKAKSLSLYQEEIVNDWRGFGQIQRDHERFKAGIIQIGGEMEKIEYHKAVTQYWSFIPSGLETKAINSIEAEVQRMGFTGYVRKVPVSAQSLNAVAQDLGEYSRMIYQAKFGKPRQKLPKPKGGQ